MNEHENMESFLSELIQNAPFAEEAVKDELAFDEELNLYMVMSHIARRSKRLLECGDDPSRVMLRDLFAFLETKLICGTDNEQNLIIVGYLEALDPTDISTNDLVALMGRETQRQFKRLCNFWNLRPLDENESSDKG